MLPLRSSEYLVRGYNIAGRQAVYDLDVDIRQYRVHVLQHSSTCFPTLLRGILLGMIIEFFVYQPIDLMKIAFCLDFGDELLHRGNVVVCIGR